MVSLSNFQGGKRIQNAEWMRSFRRGDFSECSELSMTLCWVPSGEFVMGSPENEPGRKDDETPHKVTVSHGFWMSKTPVTQEQWIAVMGLDENRSTFGPHRDITGGVRDLPVDSIGWRDALSYCRKLNNGTTRLLPEGWTWTLPTEAQWEYACRAGESGIHHGELDAVAWYDENSQDRTQHVCLKKPNAWGLHDMLGNVAEWCMDWHGPYHQNHVADPRGPQLGKSRINRGGSWTSTAESCRAASRSQIILKTGGHASRFIASEGFRVIAAKSDTLVSQGYQPDFDDHELNQKLLTHLVERMPEILKKKSQWKIVDRRTGETIKKTGYKPDADGLQRLACVRHYEEIEVISKYSFPRIHTNLEDELAELQRDELVNQILTCAQNYAFKIKE